MESALQTERAAGEQLKHQEAELQQRLEQEMQNFASLQKELNIKTDQTATLQEVLQMKMEDEKETQERVQQLAQELTKFKQATEVSEATVRNHEELIKSLTQENVSLGAQLDLERQKVTKATDQLAEFKSSFSYDINK